MGNEISLEEKMLDSSENNIFKCFEGWIDRENEHSDLKAVETVNKKIHLITKGTIVAVLAKSLLKY